MKSEMIAYYRAMLLVGIRDKFDAAFEHALETQEPLSDFVLSLSTCISDDNRVLSILREYTLNHPADEQAVCDLVLEDVCSRYLAGQMTRGDVAELLYRIVMNLDKFMDDPWHQLTYPHYDLELWQDGFVTEEVFNQCFDAWFFRRERLNAWQLQAELNKK